jgi:hypothetical protein
MGCRELPEPILTFDLYEEWIAATRGTVIIHMDESASLVYMLIRGFVSDIQRLKNLVASLPVANQSVLKTLLGTMCTF